MQLKKIITNIGEGINLEGRIYSPYATKIEGSAFGEIISKEGITISKYGIVKGNIKTENAVIEGKLIGNLIASGKVEITSTGAFFGNLVMKDANFILQKGGTFNGKRFSAINEEVFEINKDEILTGLQIKFKKVA
jgi:cytoskeletal protein CcmA (bactofilin family)